MLYNILMWGQFYAFMLFFPELLPEYSKTGCYWIWRMTRASLTPTGYGWYYSSVHLSLSLSPESQQFSSASWCKSGNNNFRRQFHISSLRCCETHCWHLANANEGGLHFICRDKSSERLHEKLKREDGSAINNALVTRDNPHAFINLRHCKKKLFLLNISR